MTARDSWCRAPRKTSALELGGSKVCVQGGTTTEANLGDYFGANNMTYEAVVTKSAAESLAAYTKASAA